MQRLYNLFGINDIDDIIKETRTYNQGFESGFEIENKPDPDPTLFQKPGPTKTPGAGSETLLIMSTMGLTPDLVYQKFADSDMSKKQGRIFTHCGSGSDRLRAFW